jgi:hypothetical protein
MNENIARDQLVESQNQPEKPWVKIALFSVLGLVLVGGLIFVAVKVGVPSKPQPKACSTEAKICPDGSAVGRTGPNCEFAPCPTQASRDGTADWKTYTNTDQGYSIRFSNNFFVQKWTLVDYILDSTSFFLVKYQNQQLPQQPEIGIAVYSDEGLSFGEWWRKHSTDKPFGSIEDSTIYYFGVGVVGQAQNGMRWWTFSDETYGIQTNHQMIARNGKIYDLHYTNLLGEDLKPIFNLMLSTFRFLPSGNSGQEE